MSGEDLFAFSRGGSLGADVLKALARELFGPNVDYGPTIDRLRRLKRGAAGVGITPRPRVGTPACPAGGHHGNEGAGRGSRKLPSHEALRPRWME